jgi:hypothetical protein
VTSPEPIATEGNNNDGWYGDVTEETHVKPKFCKMPGSLNLTVVDTNRRPESSNYLQKIYVFIWAR